MGFRVCGLFQVLVACGGSGAQAEESCDKVR